MLDQLIGESHWLNILLTQMVLALDPSAYGDCERMCGFTRTLQTFVRLFR